MSTTLVSLAASGGTILLGTLGWVTAHQRLLTRVLGELAALKQTSTTVHPAVRAELAAIVHQAATAAIDGTPAVPLDPPPAGGGTTPPRSTT